MSIINQVLNDLEQRENKSHALDLKKFTALELEQPRSKVKWLAAIVIITILTASGGIYWYQYNIKVAKPAALSLPAAEATQVAITAPQETAVELPTSVPSVVKPVETQDVIASQPKLIVTSTPPPQVIVATTAALKKKPQVAQFEHTEQLTIKPVKLTLAQLAQLKFKQAIEQQRQGFYGAAQDLWRASLLAQADYHPSREHLALSLVAQVKTDIALDILNKAINQFPKYQPYQILAANIYLQTNNRRQALDVLRQPYLVDTSENPHLALAGSLAQQLQQWHQAELNYQVLVTRNGQNEKWLIGLAIALDGQGKTDLALSRYIQFSQLANTSDILKNYAAERILRLQDQQSSAQQLSVQQQRDNNGKT